MSLLGVLLGVLVDGPFMWFVKANLREFSWVIIAAED